MLVFQPNLGITVPDEAERSEVIICLDCSNSMVQAKSADGILKKESSTWVKS